MRTCTHTHTDILLLGTLPLRDMHIVEDNVALTFTKRMWEKTSMFVSRYWSCPWRVWNCSRDLVNSAWDELMLHMHACIVKELHKKLNVLHNSVTDKC